MTIPITSATHMQTHQAPALKDIQIDDAIYDTVELFYPGQVLPLHLQLHDVMNIMNCNIDEAVALCKKIGQYYGDASLRLLIPHFCNYMGVDELWIQLFLASLKETRPPMHLQLEKFRKGITYNIETLHNRALLWHKEYPFGEPQLKRKEPYRMFVHPDEIAAVAKIHLRTAQKMFQDLRKELKLRKQAMISIKKFCFFYPEYEEDELRKALNSMYGDDE